MISPESKYGAEELARRYPAYAGTSLFVSIVVVISVFLYPLIMSALRPPADDKIPVKVTRVINYSELAAPPPIDLERRLPEPLTAAPQPKTVQFLPPVVKKDEEVQDDEMLPTLDELQSARIGTVSIVGADSVYYDHANAEMVLPAEEPETPEPFTFVEQMPEFEGGQQALYAYLSANVSYPSIAREAQIQGTVIVAFIVEPDGSITDVQVVRSVHQMLDQEAVRVIAGMPKWKPGKQNNMPVRVRFTLPINFTLRSN